MSYVIVKTKGSIKSFFTIEAGRRVWTMLKGNAILFATERSAQKLVDADWIVPGKGNISVEPKGR